MKEEILQYLKTDRSHKKGVELYMKHGLKVSFKKQLNTQSENELIHGILLDELRQLCALSIAEFRVIQRNPVSVYQAQAKKKVNVKETPAKPSAEDKEKLITGIPENVRKTIRLREEFPFLAEKDCPGILKLLVHDMITCYDKYVKAHEALFMAENEEQIFKFASETVENYLENREIWDELNHYKQNGELLGKHPLFSQQERFSEMAGWPTPKLYKRMETLKKMINGYDVKIKENKKPEKMKDWQDKRQQFVEELAEVKRILNISDEE